MVSTLDCSSSSVQLYDLKFIIILFLMVCKDRKKIHNFAANFGNNNLSQITQVTSVRKKGK
jgi:hypothetical protein